MQTIGESFFNSLPSDPVTLLRLLLVVDMQSDIWISRVSFCLFICFNWIQKLPHIALAVYCPNIWANICPATDVIAHRALILGLFRITESWKRSKIILLDIYCKNIKKTFILLSILLPAWLYAPIQSLFSSHLLLFVTNELRLRLHKASVSVRL